jgi:hypothetical protein
MLIKKRNHFLIFLFIGVTISITHVFILYKSYKNVNNMAMLKDLNRIQQPVYQHTEVI